jgi:hypothetical protein
MKTLTTILTIILLVAISSVAISGGPPTKPREVLPPVIFMPPPPPPTPIVVQPPAPRMRALLGAIVYMTDYKSTLTQNGFPNFNFGEAFKWSAKEACTEISLGVVVPNYIDASFTKILPILRSGVGIPIVPITLGGGTFGPRLADTVELTTKLAGERFLIATPYFTDKTVMPSLMCEWWHLNAGIKGSPNTTTTSQLPVDVKQDFHNIMLGGGLSGETGKNPINLSYKAMYVAGGQTTGWLAEMGVGFKQDNMSASLGYRYNARKLSFGTGSVEVETNGPFASLNLIF